MLKWCNWLSNMKEVKPKAKKINDTMLKAQVFILVGISGLIINSQKNHLHDTKISGTIGKLSYSKGKNDNNEHYTTLKIDNRDYKLTFTSALGNEFSFIDVARVGDTVFKASNNDTLFVKRIGFNSGRDLPFIVRGYIVK